eukprot:TRINITY_DN19264_c0_g1_i1.p1 TRINITY_DN19264_c0_g1~~TRINITY_DN19264_c0_g1_i1.p1  ORF type:complete len:819 (+),score=189.26 TRINITY_DN19264_c0_g1_i1:108-2564(+)
MVQTSEMTTTTSTTPEPRICEPGGSGVLLPLGGEAETKWDNRAKVFLYGAGMVYCFLGVGVISDVFMSAIERITSQKKRSRCPETDRFRTVNVWNETVANLTLMALGSSAPEILLAVGDVLKNSMFAGALGPSTIVGSAAFNLFCIIAVCINAIPAGETRQIKEMGVFYITAVWSIWAYIWLLIIVSFWTPPVITLFEGGLTVLFFPVLVWISYCSDVGMLTVDNIVGSIKGFFTVDTGMSSSSDAELGGLQILCLMVRWVCLLFLKIICGIARIFFGLFKCFFKVFCCGCCCFRRKKRPAHDHHHHHTHHPDEEAPVKDGDDGAEAAEGKAAEEVDIYSEEQFDDDAPILDEDGEPIDCDEGVFAFRTEYLEIWVGREPVQAVIPVLRKNGEEGRVSVNYRMDFLTATPGYDYEDEDGTLEYRSGVKVQDIALTIHPKRPGERDDLMQIVLEDPDGGAMIDPDADGDDDMAILTIMLRNEDAGEHSFGARLYGALDALVNLDEIWLGTVTWKEEIRDSLYVNGSLEAQQEAHWADWVSHVIVLPWSFYYKLLTPPPTYLGGWVCFVGALMHIGCLTSLIGDMAELFGCAGGINDSITAITFVALGTSLPDTFASKTAATQDEWADASIVNVTGSNSVNVFLGIGLPWFMAAVYWKLEGPTDEWIAKYPEHYKTYPQAGFIVMGAGDLAYSVAVFTLGAMVCLGVIRLRRTSCGGELGGTADIKAVSSFLLIMLWVSYIGLQIWKSNKPNATIVDQALSLCLCVPVIMCLMVVFLVLLQVLKVSKKYIGEQGFWGIFIASCVVGMRMVGFIMFQREQV